MFGFGDKKNNSVEASEVVRGLMLYHYASCPFCSRVRLHIQQQAWSIEERDILQDSSWRQELLINGGKTQVPCLKIESESGAVQWLYESINIVNYLNDHLS